jgi:autotransporter-associated beta strand protein
MENRKTIRSWSNKSRDNRWRRLLIARWAWLAAGCLFTMAAHALDATWRTDAPTNDWNSSTNWLPSGPPDGIAAFGESTTTAITFTSIPTTIVGTLQFNSTQAYTFDLANDLNINQGGVLPNNAAPSFTTHSGTFIQFDNSATAGNSVINVSTGGVADFEKLTTAATAVITNAGITEFFDSGNAASATITTNSGGVVKFAGTSTGGAATFITNTGGVVKFAGTSTGGAATFITNTGGIFDISGLTSDGMTAGSIAGGGIYALGSKALTVGNEVSTKVSGTITDGGIVNEPGGSLVKVGSGTLTLSGANTYTGGTTITAGTLQLGDGGSSGSILGNVHDNSNFAFNRSDVVTFAGIVSGTGRLSQNGAGTLTLTGVNNYTGGTNISTGTVVAGVNDALGTGPIQIFTGTLRIPDGVTLHNEVIFGAGGLLDNLGTLIGNVTDGESAPERVINSGTINGNVALAGPEDIVQLFTGSKITGDLTLAANDNNSTLI